MEKGTIITEKELRERCWMYLITMGRRKLYSKGKYRILWDMDTNKIEMFYKSGNGPREAQP